MVPRSSVALLFVLTLGAVAAPESGPIWPDLAPGESSHNTGEVQPFRPGENPPVERVINIRKPTFTAHVPIKPNGTGVVILPGGGFGR